MRGRKRHRKKATKKYIALSARWLNECARRQFAAPPMRYVPGERRCVPREASSDG